MYSDDRLSGVELLALYGDDDRIGFDFGHSFKKAVQMTPQAQLYKYARKKIHGDDDRLGAFLPGLKKVGKVTGGITGGIAKSFLPASMVDSLSKLDPTKKGTITQKVTEAKKASNVPAKKVEVVPKKALKIDTKKVLIIGGSGLGAIILLKILLSSHK